MDEQAKREVPGEFGVIAYDVKDFVGDYQCIDYDDPRGERLSQLREEFDLEAIIRDCATEFEAFLALKRWVRSRWNHGWSASFKTVQDGLDILREAAKGEQFCCGHYTRVFIDCATALGWPARPVGICIASCEFPRDYNVGNVGHAVAETWSNEHEKWVLMDPDINCYYERDGVPLSALEIREAWLSGEGDAVRQVLDEPTFVVPSGDTVAIAKQFTPGLNEFDDEIVRLVCERFTRHQVLDYYARVRIAGWEFVDRRCLPTFVWHFQPSPEVRPTCDPARMYWSVNMVRMSVKPSWTDGEGQLTVSLEHCMPFFDRYEARIDEGAWERREEGFDWPMHEGVNRLECRAVNVMDRPGIVSRIDVAYARARW